MGISLGKPFRVCLLAGENVCLCGFCFAWKFRATIRALPLSLISLFFCEEAERVLWRKHGGNVCQRGEILEKCELWIFIWVGWIMRTRGSMVGDLV